MYIYVPCSGDASRAHDASMPGSCALTTRPAADIAAVPLLFPNVQPWGGAGICAEVDPKKLLQN